MLVPSLLDVIPHIQMEQLRTRIQKSSDQQNKYITVFTLIGQTSINDLSIMQIMIDKYTCKS